MKKEIKPYAFIDREGKEITKKGKAYGFINCSASREQIEAELPTIRELVETPSSLEISITDDLRNVKGDKKLTALAQEANRARLNYMFQAEYPNRNNEEAADELAAILNQAYQSPLYTEGKQFTGAIVYEKNGRYVFRD